MKSKSILSLQMHQVSDLFFRGIITVLLIAMAGCTLTSGEGSSDEDGNLQETQIALAVQQTRLAEEEASATQQAQQEPQQPAVQPTTPAGEAPTPDMSATQAAMQATQSALELRYSADTSHRYASGASAPNTDGGKPTP